MRNGGGKAKGSEYEREICKKLSRWVSGGQREDLFWRSAMSGGRATVGKRKGKDLARHAGDISATAPEGHILTDDFYIECKRYADLNLASFIFKGVGKLASFWKEAIEQAEAHNKIPMLIAREDRGETFVLLPCESMLARGFVGYSYQFNSAAWLLRLQQARVDIFIFEKLMEKPYSPPAKYHNPPITQMFKPGEVKRILESPVNKIEVASKEKQIEPWGARKGTIARAMDITDGGENERARKSIKRIKA